MESSSESEIYSRSREHRSRGRDALRRKNSRDIAMDSVGIAEKIDALADTLQDTSRNLNKVDQMLGQYREHTDDHADAIATLQDSLEESIHQLQSQRLKRSARGCSASFSTLHSSLENGNNFGGRHHNATSPLTDYRSLEMSNRRSATVRFRDPCQTEEQIHSLHQALRDLRSDQLQLGHEIDQEILKRNRSDIETRKTLVDLTKQIQESPVEEAVSLRVEKRLQKIESEILSQQQMVSERQCKQRGIMSSELQEALKRCDAQNHPSEDSYRNRFLRSESEICKLEQELESARKQLDRSEGGRGALFQQMEDMQAELSRSERERAQLQREISLLRFQHRSVTELQEKAAQEGLRQGGKVLERELEDLRVQLRQSSSLNETQELKRTVERKENEKKQLVLQIEALSSDLEQRDHQQLQILKEVQALSEDRGAELAKVEAQLAENEKKKEELRTKAQEAIRQWKAKCRKLECQLQELKERQGMNQPTQALAERESVLRQQIEGTRKQLAEVLGHLAQREEEVRQCSVALAEARSQLVILKQELRDSRESLRSLEDETQRQSLIQTRLREENQKLEKRLEDLGNRREQEQGNLLELQNLVKSLSAERANLNGRLAEAESFRKEQESRFALAQEEKASLGQQLQLEREVHQRELDHLRQQEDKIKQNHSVQKTLRLYHQEREELKALIKDLKTEAVVDKELVRVLQQKLDRMKAECDNLTEQLSSSEESHAKLHKMCQMLKKELEIQFSEQVEERRHAAEDSMAEMQKKIADLKLEQTSILHAVESQIDLACKAVCKDSAAKLKAVMLTSGQQNDCHHWLAEMKTKLQWLCDEVRVHETREKKLTRVVQQCKEQMKMLKQSRDSEQQNLLDRITQLERLLQDIHSEKQDLLEKSRRKDDEMRSLQDRVLDLEMSTRLALDHLESVPEKLSLLEDFKDLEESQRQREAVEQRYAKYKEIVGALQHQLEESKRRIQEYRDEKLDATSWSLHLDGLSSSLRSQNKFLTSNASPHRCLDSLDGLECAAAVSKNTVLQTTVQTLNR